MIGIKTQELHRLQRIVRRKEHQKYKTVEIYIFSLFHITDNQSLRLLKH